MRISMAKGTETEEFVVLSKVRTGLKREFAFAFKSQNEIAGSLGRTRTRKPATNGADEAPSIKRIREVVPVSRKSVHKEGLNEGIEILSGKGESDAKLVVESEGDLNSDVVDAVSDDDNKSHSVQSIRTGDTTELNCASDDVDKSRKRFTRSILNSSSEQVKDLPTTGEGDTASSNSLMTKNVDKLCSKSSLKFAPRKLKDLLDTGLLEGLSVRYSRGVKHKVLKEIGLQGVIRGSGILCYCENCKGMNVVTPTVYEIHAGSLNKRPPDYMYLDNGNTLRDVLNSCKLCKLDDLGATIRKDIGLTAPEKSLYCINCKGSISVAGKGKKRLLCDACIEIKAPEETPKKLTKACERPAPVHKSFDNGKKSSALVKKRQGKLTRKDLRLHKLVFEDDVLPDGSEVGYYVRGKKILSGYKQGSGILCSCCQNEVSPSQFEAHAGWASRRKPYLHIYTSNGVSLHELSISLSRTMRFSTQENDDLCTICYQPGNLLCCDGCPRSFHKECIPLAKVPEETWYCRYCSDLFEKEKFAERNANAIAAGRVAGIDPIEQITHRCIRVVKTQDQESDSGGCALCRAHDFAKGGFSRRTVMLCDQCEREFHVGCLQDHGMQDLKELPAGKWFCCSGCSGINSALQQMIEDGDQQIPDCLLNMIKQKHAVIGQEDVKLDIKWRLLSGNISAVGNTRALLSKAVSVFHEQFDPIVLPNSNQDMIPHMVYGRNVKDREFGGMYCAVLNINSVIVSAGIFRVLGKDIAELPLVATASGHEKLGYFQALYSCIEKLLRDLDVNHLWLPAADEAKPLWTSRFGFSDFPRDEFVEFKKRFALMIFDGTCALRKPISVSKEHDAVDLHGVAMQTSDTIEASGIVSTDNATNCVGSPDCGKEALEMVLKEDGVTQSDAVQASGISQEDNDKQGVDSNSNSNSMEVEVGVYKTDGVTDFEAVLASGMMAQDDGKRGISENSIEVEVGGWKKFGVTQGDAAASGMAQEGGKQAFGETAMEVQQSGQQ